MRDESREQTGCFIAVLMLMSSAYALKALFRRIILAFSAEQVATARYAAPMVGALAFAFIVFAFFALRLSRLAIAAYLVCAVLGGLLTVLLGLGWDVAVSMFIGACSTVVILIARRDIL